MLAEPSSEIMTEEEDEIKEAAQDRYADVEEFCSEAVDAEANKDGEDSTHTDLQHSEPPPPPLMLVNILDYVALKHNEENFIFWWLFLANQDSVFQV